MPDSTKSTVAIALISAVSAVIVAMITTYGTISFSEPEITRLKKELESISEKERVLNLPIGTVISSLLKPKQFEKNYGDSWVLADGTRVSVNTRYADITGDTKIPDLRGLFLRGMNYGRTDEFRDPDGENRLPGQPQPDQFASHGHGFSWVTVKASGTTLPNNYPILPNEYHPGEANQGAGEAVRPAGKKETRPKNASVYYYVKVN